DGYWYYVRYETGKEHPIYARRKGEMSAPEEVMLDANEMAKGHDFFKIGRASVSPNGQLLAYTQDTVGRHQYTLHVKNLESGELYEDTAANISPDVAWTNDNRTILYVSKHPTTLLPYRVHKHALGTDTSADTLVYEEKDNTFYTGV